jgi:zinc transporter 1/2/3
MLMLTAAACFAVAAGQAAASGGVDAIQADMQQREPSWRRQLSSGNWQARQLRHAGIDHDSEAEEAAHGAAEAPGPETATTDAAGGAAVVTDSGRSYTWLKWTAAGVLFLEGLVGVLVPVCMKLTVHAGWLMSLVNCFAGGVFFTFGIMHLGPDALEAQDAVGLDRFPLAAMLIALSFLTIFFLHRILAPALRLTPHLHTLNAATTPDGRPIMPKAGKEHGVGSCKRCGDACGCAGGVKAGACGAGCQAGGCQCAHRVDPDPEAEADKANAATFGPTAATLTAAVAPMQRPYEDEVMPQPQQRTAVRVAALVPPALILLGLLAHTVLEGLAIGLQQSYGDVVSAFVAMASHRWVESVAVAAAFVAAGSGIMAVVAFLLPFSLGPLVGIAIGVSVDNTNAWVVLVLFALVAGLFIYVGSVGIVAEEFAKHDNPAFAATRPKGARFYMYAALFFGFVVVALLQLVPE